MKVVDVRVKPSSKKGSFVQASLIGELLIYVKEAPIDGKANKAVTELLAKYFEVPKSNIELISGRTSRHKRFKISD